MRAISEDRAERAGGVELKLVLATARATSPVSHVLLQDVTCLCTAKANLDETNEHHKSEEAMVERHFLMPCFFDDHLQPHGFAPAVCPFRRTKRMRNIGSWRRSS